MIWNLMSTAPKNGIAVLVLLNGSNIPYAVRWIGPIQGGGWSMTWDAHELHAADGPRYWAHCPADPDAPKTER